MRSILALSLALLVLAAEAPGVFTETPVCAAVDGREAATQTRTRGTAGTPSCCGTASCRMHAKGCDAEACPMSVAKRGPAAATAKAPGEARGPTLCAPSCGREGVRVVPGAPDPGTLDLSRAPVILLSEARAIHSARRNLPLQNPAPADPPPRA